MPNDYLLTADGPLPFGLSTLLHEVAEEHSEELFEFEGTATEVAVFWEEWGGVEKVRALNVHLDRLASW